MELLILALLTTFLYSLYIRLFKKASQYERDEGLESHKIKNGTITMGGIIFAVIPLFFVSYNQSVINICITVILYAILGFADDLLIIMKKNNKGIPATIKFILQIIIAGISFFLYLNTDLDTNIRLFNFSFDIKWIYGLFILFILSASTNAFNLTDGVDGLCSGLCIIISFGFLYISYIKNEYEIFYLILCLTISLFVFWCFNYPKAFLFMGDVGSLFLGAFYSIVAIYLDILIPFIIMALLFIFETISVILQVYIYKKNKKRIFKMAPFHHHLELSGFKEGQVDGLFYIIQIFLVFIGVLTYFIL